MFNNLFSVSMDLPALDISCAWSYINQMSEVGQLGSYGKKGPLHESQEAGGAVPLPTSD